MGEKNVQELLAHGASQIDQLIKQNRDYCACYAEVVYQLAEEECSKCRRGWGELKQSHENLPAIAEE
jgi:hypothetical protein